MLKIHGFSLRKTEKATIVQLFCCVFDQNAWFELTFEDDSRDGDARLICAESAIDSGTADFAKLEEYLLCDQLFEDLYANERWPEIDAAMLVTYRLGPLR